MSDVPHWFDPDIIDRELRNRDKEIFRLKNKLKQIAELAHDKSPVLEIVGHVHDERLLEAMQGFDPWRPAPMKLDHLKSLFGIGLLIFVLAGCTNMPTQFHAKERHCKYDRVGVEYELSCSSKGTVKLEDVNDLFR